MSDNVQYFAGINHLCEEMNFHFIVAKLFSDLAGNIDWPFHAKTSLNGMQLSSRNDDLNHFQACTQHHKAREEKDMGTVHDLL